jgi:hypothetical protein
VSSTDEKRVYGDREGARTLHLATGTGVVRVAVAGDGAVHGERGEG